MFKPGDKIKCINVDDPNNYLKYHTQKPELNSIYTVRRCYQWEDTWGVLVEELKNPSVPVKALGGLAEAAFNYKRFIKVKEAPKQEIKKEEELLA